MADQGNGVYIWDADHNEFRYIGQVLGGTTVEANPSGVATGDLSKIGIAGTIYNINGLPVIASGDAGKVLTVNAGETGVEWTTPSGGGGAVIPTNMSYQSQIQSVYNSGGTTLLYTRTNDTPFTFTAGTTYLLRTKVNHKVGKQIFFNPLKNFWLGYAVMSGSYTVDIATNWGIPELEDFGTYDQIELLPQSLVVTGYNDLYGQTFGTANICGYRETGMAENVTIDEISFIIQIEFTPSTNVTWTPTEYASDVNIQNSGSGTIMTGVSNYISE